MEHLTQKSCVDFAEVLASKAAVPGGGGAAALVGALGVALCSMVGNFTIGKKKYAAVEEDVKVLQIRAEALRLRLLELVDMDADAFAPLAKAYAIPMDNPARDEILETATLNACKAPMEMVERCADAIDLLEEMLEKGNKMLISDVGCGALMCKAAMESAAMNVYVNTKSLMNRDQAMHIETKVDNLLNGYLTKANTIAQSVITHIR